jgi:ABC-type transporter Mla MlaB component
MLESLKKAINRNSKQQEKKAIKPNSDAKAVTGMTSFAGLTAAQMKRELELAGTRSDNLAPSKIGEDALNSLELSANQANKNKAPMVNVSSSSFTESVATIYAEGETGVAIDRLKEHINEKRGVVEPRIWYMLMDAYQITNNQMAFEKAAVAFSNLFEQSPPSWGTSNGTGKKGVLAGKNIMILEPHFKQEYTERFKDFLKSAKEESFCRINVSQCKFEQSDFSALLQFHKLLIDLRKAKVMGILMGDNNIINFCKIYINPNVTNRTLKDEFVQNESFFWLLYLELLQWKGKHEEFDNVAIQYAMKFEISPPDWDDNGVMTFDKNEEENNESSYSVIDRVINSNNIQNLLDVIKADFSKGDKSELELSQVDRIDFASAGAISHFIQELWTEPEHRQKEVIFKYPNEMILTLLEMVGVTEFVTIQPKAR